ncbi:multimeric flavodoxin WrbA [Saccharopolyspora erythraea NRRL 2338]|uniref:Uncharacterized protein n=2 Tax=Saccharopolyspora erythraea TaxID=1836 RepID=A4FDQ1_SACEN|nr:flavodoxin family protein [Saccharopolyspora erythraea]EQD85717.1 hypothetical protein N599_13550 [Saccharopolyspora erythraea D]PFG95911.1 multimeric flavodoxin WrbA [Saccharopolyspora erythraea NRRL 2338]QRK92481.1 flavodoxin family protein [Saccharopolyspora erythraea]CAM02176.1 hypothetical protein SACE_2898 [Saccharopolyspora erythraea NRRL 2338]
MTRLLLVYHSRTGTHRRLAEWAARSAERRGAEVRVRQVPALPGDAVGDAGIPVAELDDLRWAQAVIFGSPTHFGSPTATFKRFLDSTSPLWLNNELRRLVVGAMSSSRSRRGGRDSTVLTIQRSVLHWGATVVTGFRSPSNELSPYGVSVSLQAAAPEPAVVGAVDAFVESVISVAADLNGVRRVRCPTIALVADAVDADLAGLADVVAAAVAADGASVVRLGTEAACDPDRLTGIDAVAVGATVRVGLPDVRVVAMLQEWGGSGKKGPLAGMPATGFVLTTAEEDGAEAGVLALYTSLMHAGAVIVPSGRPDEPVLGGAGNPYGTSLAGGASTASWAAAHTEAADHMRRLVRVAGRLGRSEAV